MKFERLPFIMKNLIRYQATMKENDWNKGFDLLRSIEFQEGVYKTGPMFFSMEPAENEPRYRNFEFFMPVNFQVEGE
ncbi:hypothetical protein [Enterococcus rivorum]|uniref:GyrI-like small molecule binding domain-containing protein n=3 Tax=Enterococcus rivorum TaxID=762845 RepID=A0A1E5KUW4_9ENTE|nr:hypothetical protein [Enterococcus rivorum]MBP2099085.1 hypothetical protein [Enterococcus rivorum]OEH81662.1 hypothetical protein BCR26_15970 [Enterococcus rivorum]